MNKVMVVTGAASGIGLASAKACHREGAIVVLTDIDIEAGKLASRSMASSEFIALDTSSDIAWDGVLDAVLDRYGRIDVLVNNAGIGIRKSVLETTVEDWHKIMSVNLTGVFYGMRAVIARMRDRGGGSVINMSSIAGKIGLPLSPAYCASKGGVTLLTKSVALECAEKGWKIRVNSIHPGFIDTPLVQRAVKQMPDPPWGLQGLLEKHPMGRLGLPQDIAQGVVFLASDESSFMTGAELVIDGGYTAR
jgi:NAD(P)-dependent dehydrogenase (short-subunit alcohol dehydrogenase family)